MSAVERAEGRIEIGIRAHRRRRGRRSGRRPSHRRRTAPRTAAATAFGGPLAAGRRSRPSKRRWTGAGVPVAWRSRRSPAGSRAAAPVRRASLEARCRRSSASHSRTARHNAAVAIAPISGLSGTLVKRRRSGRGDQKVSARRRSRQMQRPARAGLPRAGREARFVPANRWRCRPRRERQSRRRLPAA